MKLIICTFICLLTTSDYLLAQDQAGNPPSEIVKYYFVELITNPDRPELPKPEVDSIQRAHMSNIAAMAASGKLMLAGPFEGGGGLFIFDVPSMEDAEKLVAQDPAVSAGRLNTKIRAWYTGKGVFAQEEKNK